MRRTTPQSENLVSSPAQNGSAPSTSNPINDVLPSENPESDNLQDMIIPPAITESLLPETNPLMDPISVLMPAVDEAVHSDPKNDPINVLIPSLPH